MMKQAENRAKKEKDKGKQREKRRELREWDRKNRYPGIGGVPIPGCQDYKKFVKMDSGSRVIANTSHRPIQWHHR